ncbi:sulfatase-like hydrolase/transferase [Catenulispora pinisilvae]|uniref:sulfatase-like hydrolase/transferase n=1 Tax=Catenulispora pinisilvae TaxID=2705253 RepID=UPI0018924540|nr:sulfatase-like hydrolase/transferase [Catenulispora pinisilvae]
MKAVMVMFDSLNRRFLPPYGAADWIHAPNFTRLAERTATFENCYAGSMPCMPARRELHTGRYNFLHRSWGPLEPFDDSCPEMLREQAGVHTHLVTDHQHYWEDGGATYHNRYRTYEFFRGQEGDAWKGHVADPEIPESLRSMRGEKWRQDWVNRSHMPTETEQPQTLTFDAGLEFISTNKDQDTWFLQIETFDPHEPFFSHQPYKDLYPHEYDGPQYDWPDYRMVLETPEQVEHVRLEYAALLSMCDRSLGRVLDAFDEYRLWDDTLLIVCTDHGFLLGEHGWWGKNVQPWYDETIHTPLFIWDPRSRVAGERRASLVQTIDIGPTLLEFFGVDRTPDMLGRPLRETVADDTPVRAAGIFGAFGGHVSVTDGRYVYMRACVEASNTPLFEHTLMPTHMAARFRPEELRSAELVPGGTFAFTKGVPVLKAPGWAISPARFGSLLFDLESDPDQQSPVVDDDLELRMAGLLVETMRTADAPASQYLRLGLPQDGAVTSAHLLVRIQREAAEAAAAAPPLKPEDFPTGPRSVHTPIRDLAADPDAERVLRDAGLGQVLDGGILKMVGDIPLLQLAALAGGLLTREILQKIADGLAALEPVEEPVEAP